MTANPSWSAEGTSLVSVKIYLHPVQRQRLRELAARRGVSMSEYMKLLIDRDHRGSMRVD